MDDFCKYFKDYFIVKKWVTTQAIWGFSSIEKFTRPFVINIEFLVYVREING